LFGLFFTVQIIAFFADRVGCGDAGLLLELIRSTNSATLAHRISTYEVEAKQKQEISKLASLLLREQYYRVFYPGRFAHSPILDALNSYLLNTLT
jgi:hypothetical protein